MRIQLRKKLLGFRNMQEKLENTCIVHVKSRFAGNSVICFPNGLLSTSVHSMHCNQAQGRRNGKGWQAPLGYHNLTAK